MTDKCTRCSRKIDARTLAAGGELCWECRTGDTPKEPLSFRGRNGWARYESAHVHGRIGHGDPIAIEMYSRRRGEYPPIVITGEREEVRALLIELIEKIDAQEPREVSRKVEGLTKGAQP